MGALCLCNLIADWDGMFQLKILMTMGRMVKIHRFLFDFLFCLITSCLAVGEKPNKELGMPGWLGFLWPSSTLKGKTWENRILSKVSFSLFKYIPLYKYLVIHLNIYVYMYIRVYIYIYTCVCIDNIYIYYITCNRHIYIYQIYKI